MTHTDGELPGSSGGGIYWQAWIPDDSIAVVLLVHGYAEHSGRYAHVAARLNKAGYAAYAVDHQGHGRSEGVRGSVGSMAGVVADLDAVRDLAQAAHPGLPVFLLGHSMGGLIALDYLVTKGQDSVAGLVLSGPAIDPGDGNRVQFALARFLSRLAPNAPLADLGNENVSRDPAVVARYRADPLNYLGKIRARTGAEGLAAVQRVSQALGTITLPLLVLHGGDDKLASPDGSRLVHDGVASSDKTLKIYDGLYHEIFNEPEKEVVLSDVVTWLDGHP